MIWQDLVIGAAQILLVAGLIPTLRDRSQWPHKATCEITSACLAAMVLAFGSLELWLATVTTAAATAIWLRMAFR